MNDNNDKLSNTPANGDGFSELDLALIGVNVFGNRPSGAKPDLYEIAAWRQGELSSEREREVRSHLANDAEVYQLLLDYLDAEAFARETASTASETPLETDSVRREASSSRICDDEGGSFFSKLRALFGLPTPALAGALAVAALAILVTPLLQRGSSNPDDGNIESATTTMMTYAEGFDLSGLAAPAITRSLAGVLPPASIEELGEMLVKRGMADILGTLPADSVNDEWQNWHDVTLEQTAVPCEDSIDAAWCTANTSELEAVGQWLMTTYLACDSGLLADNAELGKEQFDTRDRVLALKSAQVLENGLLAPLFSSNHEVENIDTLCSAVSDIIDASGS
ncbi:MAG: hypothetical protein CSB44_04320 [Gammaproteobacteria bacterium]|nr:MAG: hypothetical protein CSB44_04320 [Gammaproteobacteria bacterium]